MRYVSVFLSFFGVFKQVNPTCGLSKKKRCFLRATCVEEDFICTKTGMENSGDVSRLRVNRKCTTVRECVWKRRRRRRRGESMSDEEQSAQTMVDGSSECSKSECWR